MDNDIYIQSDKAYETNSYTNDGVSIHNKHDDINEQFEYDVMHVDSGELIHLQIYPLKLRYL